MPMANGKQRIPQELLIELAKAARVPLYHILKEEGYDMPMDYSAEAYDPNYAISALDNLLYGSGSSSPNYASKKLIQDLENEKIIAYLADRAYSENQPRYSGRNFDYVKGEYVEGEPGEADTAFVYLNPLMSEEFVDEYESVNNLKTYNFQFREDSLRSKYKDEPVYFSTGEILKTLEHEAFLHGVEGRHGPFASEDDFPFIANQRKFDQMERNLEEKLKDSPESLKMYIQLDAMIPKDKTLGDYPVSMAEVAMFTDVNLFQQSLLDSLYKDKLKKIKQFLPEGLK